MTGRLTRRLTLLLWLASLAGASLACANPRRSPAEATLQPATRLPTAALGLTDFPTAIPASPTAPPAIQAATDLPAVLSETPPPTLAATDTAAPAADTPEPDPQGDRVEDLLGQLESAVGADEPEINDLSNVP